MQHAAGSIEDESALARRIAAAAPGIDATAESELCRRFAPRVRLYGLRHLRSEAAAADLVQEVLILTLQKLRAGAVREPDRIASFILGTCRQLVVDGRRGATRRERILDAFPAEFSDFTIENDETWDSERLRQCLERLPERERAVLIMSFFDDQPADQVGRALGHTAGNVRVIRHRAIDRLRDCLQGPEVTQ